MFERIINLNSLAHAGVKVWKKFSVCVLSFPVFVFFSAALCCFFFSRLGIYSKVAKLSGWRMLWIVNVDDEKFLRIPADTVNARDDVVSQLMENVHIHSLCSLGSRQQQRLRDSHFHFSSALWSKVAANFLVYTITKMWSYLFCWWARNSFIWIT